MKRINVLAMCGVLSLTCSAAFAQGFGRGGGFGGGPGGHGGHGGKMRSLAALPDVIDYLSAESAPETFTVELFPGADIDDSGTIEDSEWTAFADDAMQTLLDRVSNRHPDIDANEDGDIDDIELQDFLDDKIAMMKDRILDRRPELDVDGDGELSDAEAADAREERQARILERKPDVDLNGDGVFSIDEGVALKLSAIHARMNGEDGSRPGNRFGSDRSRFGRGR